MQKYVNKCEVMVNAVQRSGHHAFILELLAATDSHLFLNCVKGERIYFPRFIRANPADRFVTDMQLSLEAEMSDQKAEKKLVVYNTELCLTDEALAIFRSPVKQAALGESERKFFVTWLRDPLNNMASFFNRVGAFRAAERRKLGISIAQDDKIIKAKKIWCDHWAAIRKGEDHIGLIFNLWMRDDAYRADFFARLGLSPPPRASETSRWGVGSSFAKYEHGQAAPEANDLETRCDRFMRNPQFHEVFADEPFAEAIDSFFAAFPQLASLEERWARLRMASLGR